MSDLAGGAPPVLNTVIGLAALTHGAYAGMDLQPIWAGLLARARANPYDAGALMDMSILLQLTGQKTQGLQSQAHAIAMSRVFERSGSPGGLRILAFTTPGDFMANTPVDFLLEGSDATLTELYLGTGEPLPHVPDHDVAIVAIGESEAAGPVLSSLRSMLDRWPRPVLNNRTDVIIGLTRDGVARTFAGSSTILAPLTVRVGRADVERLANGATALNPDVAAMTFPLIVRPVGTHAGEGLLRIDSPAEFKPYLEASRSVEFYIAPFIDSAGPDGQFRKYRVAVIDKKPFISHLAISSNWMVHYLSAGMAESAQKRAEEEAAMLSFDEGFAQRHAAAFAEMQAAFDLDYYAIDCAETHDGKLLLFEADVAMIVHAMDDEETFPYKRPQMLKLFAAFQDMLARRAHKS